jgi:hypothetical protein
MYYQVVVVIEPRRTWAHSLIAHGYAQLPATGRHRLVAAKSLPSVNPDHVKVREREAKRV